MFVSNSVSVAIPNHVGVQVGSVRGPGGSEKAVLAARFRAPQDVFWSAGEDKHAYEVTQLCRLEAGEEGFVVLLSSLLFFGTGTPALVRSP